MTSARIALVGPDPSRPEGGIAVAMDGFRLALSRAHVLDTVVPAYVPGHRVRPTLRAIRPMLAAVRRGSIVYAHAGGPISIFRKTGLLRIAHTVGARTMLQIHSVELDELTRTIGGRYSLRCMLGGVDLLGVVGDYWKTLLNERVRGLPPVVVVPNPLPAWAVTRSHQAPRPTRDGPLQLMCMTRLQPGKGVDLAIEAMRHAPHARLTIAGDGPQRDQLQAQVRRLGLTRRVQFAGWLDHDRKLRALEQCDVFVLPTQYDSFGMGFVEAASLGVPSIALRWGAIPEVVDHEQTGLLADDATPEAIARAIVRCQDPAYRSELGRNAQDRARTRYGPESISDAILRGLKKHNLIEGVTQKKQQY